ncbi:MAG: hypothetical protein JSR48_14765 [Verrucomicrobia bacterium]|nr:hypothetical protein [Verrucomicrobiota bacterium]
MKPPPLPEETLGRVARMARANGLSVLIIASLGALASVAFGDLEGAAVGLVVAFGGWMELSGRQQLRRGETDGMTRLIRAQYVVMGAILVYCITRLASFDPDTALSNVTPDMRQELANEGVDVAAILRLVRIGFYTLYSVVAVVTLAYQGGMARYYGKRREPVAQALAARRNPVPPPPSRGPSPEDLVT